jgi:hypothetical protein
LAPLWLCNRTAWRFWIVSDCCLRWRLSARGLTGWIFGADPSGAVRIASAAENGPDFGVDELLADVVVGADGVNSAYAARVAS